VLIAGNQPIEAEAALARLQMPADLIASSAGWGVSKPDPAFFERIIDVASESPDSIAYVGDRMDNDVLPARAAGMVAVLLRRGPWGWMHAERPDAGAAHLLLHDLTSLPDALAAL
jgi:FMN phosphatase YigB (HAD superfamily)